MSKSCARCEKTVYPLEELKCLDKIWHKSCFKCYECGMILNMKTYKGFNKQPYCNAHCPVARATTVVDTPETRRLAENTKIQSQVKYHAEFEKQKGKLTQVADDPETLRIRNASKIISNVNYHGEYEKKKQMEERRNMLETDNNNTTAFVGELSTPYLTKSNHSAPVQQQQQYSTTAAVAANNNNPAVRGTNNSHLMEYHSTRPQQYSSATSYNNNGTAVDSNRSNDYYTHASTPNNMLNQGVSMTNANYIQDPRYALSGPMMAGPSPQQHYVSQQAVHPQHLNPTQPQVLQYQQPIKQQVQTQPTYHSAGGTHYYQAGGVPAQAGKTYSATNLGRCFRAIYDYTAQDTDEVSFLDGDLIINCQPIDDGWMNGTVQRTGKTGMLPSNYVENA